MLPLWNSWYFLALYANAEGIEGRWRTDSTHVLDRYALAKPHDLVTGVRSDMDSFDISGACNRIRDFLEVLTNWYVRSSRERFWTGDADAVDTLHTVLELTCRVAASLLPLTTEAVWRGLTGERSVHLADWPDPALVPEDAALVAAGIELVPEEYSRRMVATDPAGTAALPDCHGLVVLETEVTDDLAVEGVARDLIRVVQLARRETGLDVTDRIALTIQAPDKVVASARAHQEFLASETLAESVDFGEVAEGTGFDGVVGDGVPVRVRVPVGGPVGVSLAGSCRWGERRSVTQGCARG